MVPREARTRRNRPRQQGGKAYVVRESPLFFSLGDDGLEDQFCNMVHPETGEGEDEFPFPTEAHVLGPLPPGGASSEDTVQMVFTVNRENVEDIIVTRLVQARPECLEGLCLRELQSDCDRWALRSLGETDLIYYPRSPLGNERREYSGHS
ncbi:ANKRD17, partial [Symbiodinium sp. CCMP2456]